MPAPPGLRGSAAELVATVPLPQPFSMSDYLRRIEALRATRIFVEPAAGLLPPGAPCGLWVHIDGTDFIFHAPSSSPAYVDHIVRHELGHLLWEHTGSAGLSEEYVARLLPDLDPTMAVKVLGRASYNTEQERQAETFARLLAAVIRRQGPRDDHQPGALGVIDRLFG